MGLFDSLKKILDSAEEVVKTVASEAAAPETNTNTNTSDAKMYEDAPAKPSVKREITLFGGPEGNDEFTGCFMLSGDFIEFESHSELAPAFQYEPGNDEDYTEYKEGLPQICFGPLREPYRAAVKYREDGTRTAGDFELVDNGTFLLKAMFDYHGDAMYAYVFAEGTASEFGAFALIYSRKYVGTPFEQKLKAALDEAAATYTETKVE